MPSRGVTQLHLFSLLVFTYIHILGRCRATQAMRGRPSMLLTPREGNNEQHTCTYFSLPFNSPPDNPSPCVCYLVWLYCSLFACIVSVWNASVCICTYIVNSSVGIPQWRSKQKANSAKILIFPSLAISWRRKYISFAICGIGIQFPLNSFCV